MEPVFAPGGALRIRGGPVPRHPNNVKAFEVIAARDSLDQPVGTLFVHEPLPDLGLLNWIFIFHFFDSLPAAQRYDD